MNEIMSLQNIANTFDVSINNLRKWDKGTRPEYMHLFELAVSNVEFYPKVRELMLDFRTNVTEISQYLGVDAPFSDIEAVNPRTLRRWFESVDKKGQATAVCLGFHCHIRDLICADMNIEPPVFLRAVKESNLSIGTLVRFYLISPCDTINLLRKAGFG